MAVKPVSVVCSHRDCCVGPPRIGDQGHLRSAFADLTLLAAIFLWLASGSPATAGTAPQAPADLQLQGLNLERIDPGLLKLLATAGAEPVEIEVLVDVPRLQPVPLAPAVTTLEVAGPGVPVTATYQGRPVTGEAMRTLAMEERRRIIEGLRPQLAARREAVDAAIRLSGAAENVVGKGAAGFRLRIARDRAPEILRRLGPVLRNATLPPRLELQYDMTDVLKNMNIVQFAQAAPYDMKGLGVGVLHIEGYSGFRSRPNLTDADLRFLSPESWQPTFDGVCYTDAECCSNQCIRNDSLIGTCKTVSASTPVSGCPNCSPNNVCASDIRGQEHSTMVDLLLHEAAPEAVLYFAHPTSGCMTFDEALLQDHPYVLVGSQSWSYSVASQSECEKEWDDFIAASRISHFCSAGNAPATQIGLTGSAYNVIAVGGYTPSNNTLWANSAYLNPATGVEKPEIVAPGASVPLEAGWTRSGTSIAAPLAAGFAADMMSGTAFFANNPQAIKAYLIAGATDVDGKPAFPTSSDGKDGAGRINYLDTYYYRWGKIWSNGANNSWFNASNKIIEKATLEKNGHYTIAIAWLADGAYAKDHSALNMRMKLTVSRGSKKFESYREKNNFQLIDMVAPEAGEWTITIERVFNSGSGSINLALTVGKHS